MDKVADILDVSQATFQAEVVEKSRQVPVLVDFWAEWCGPCRMLSPTLEKLAAEHSGGFRLAKVDVDENPQLAMRFGVQGIPAVKAFRDGKVVAEFVGAQPEPAVRKFVKQLVPNQADQPTEQAAALLAAHRWTEAEAAYRRATVRGPDGAATLGLLKSLLAQGKGAEAERVLAEFPNGREEGSVEKLRPLARFLVEAQAGPECRNDGDIEAQYCRAGKLIAKGDLQGALDALLGVLRRDKRYRQGEPRLVMLGIFDILGEEDPLTREYRGKLASALF